MFKNYLKIAWKVLLRRKFFTFISLFGISFTLMVLIIVAALVDHLFAPSKPGSNLDRTLWALRVEVSGPNTSYNDFASYYILDKYVRPLKSAELVSLHSMPTSLGHAFSKSKLAVQQKFTDAEFWDIAEFDFIEGTAFSREAVDNADFVAVISEFARNQYFGEGPAVGKYVEAFGANYRVVGVIAREDIPNLMVYSDIFVPITTSRQDFSHAKLTGRYNAFVMAKDKSEFQDIRDELNAALADFQYPGHEQVSSIKCYLGSQADFIAGEFIGYENVEVGGAVIMSLTVTVMILFMVLPAVNLININLSRIIERASEIGVRKAFGASSLTLVGQFIVENILITLMGGAIGFVISAIALEMISSSGWLPFGHFSVNLNVFLAGLAVSLFFGLLSGVYPAFKMSRLHPVEALRGASS